MTKRLLFWDTSQEGVCSFTDADPTPAPLGSPSVALRLPQLTFPPTHRPPGLPHRCLQGFHAPHGLVRDAMKTPFPDRSFDVIYGNAVLHHLDSEACAPEIARLLAPGGVAVFREVQAGNIFLRLFRNLTPFLAIARRASAYRIRLRRPPAPLPNNKCFGSRPDFIIVPLCSQNVGDASAPTTDYPLSAQERYGPCPLR